MTFFVNHVVRNWHGLSKFCHYCETPSVILARFDHPNIARIFVFQNKGGIQIANLNSSGALLCAPPTGHPLFHKGAIEHQILNSSADEREARGPGSAGAADAQAIPAV